MSAQTSPNNAVVGTAFRVWLPVVLAFLGVLGMIFVGQNIRQLNFLSISPMAEVNNRFSYQVITLGMAFAYLLIVYRLRPEAFRRFARTGELNAPTSPVRWLGISSKETWRSVGLNFALVTTLATGTFLYFNFIQPKNILLAALVGWLPVAAALAVINAFVEEALTRFGVVVGLFGVIPNGVIYVISALVFGLPHYFGTPGGVVGTLMAGFLGWLLARSVVDTRGMFWAWFIHFLLDVIIFMTLLSVLA